MNQLPKIIRIKNFVIKYERTKLCDKDHLRSAHDEKVTYLSDLGGDENHLCHDFLCTFLVLIFFLCILTDLSNKLPIVVFFLV